MSFTELFPKTKGNGKASDAVVAMSCNTSTGRFQPWTSILIRPERINVPWLAQGAMAKVHLGTGVDAGRLRISPNGPFKFGLPSGRSAGIQLRIPGLQNRNEAAQPLRAVSYTIDHETIIIELPGWALAKTAQQLPVANAPGTPFKLGAPSHAEVLRGKGLPA